MLLKAFLHRPRLIGPSAGFSSVAASVVFQFDEEAAGDDDAEDLHHRDADTDGTHHHQVLGHDEIQLVHAALPTGRAASAPHTPRLCTPQRTHGQLRYSYHQNDYHDESHCNTTVVKWFSYYEYFRIYYFDNSNVSRSEDSIRYLLCDKSRAFVV